ncbi:MAG TPA: pirin family protein [Bryobacteraceae bacterium]|nr:pirin family protein [Bryobacteraceae bacterium]
MITIRRSQERGHADHGWLNTYHTFSFAAYHDPAHMGFRSLRVLNDDRVAAGRGFGAHAHRDMEILTYVLDGSLVHKDSMGEKRTFGANTVQAMSAGTGVVHSEFNASETEPVHFLQIWIEPAVEETEPSYQQIPFDPREKQGRLRLLAAPRDGLNGEPAAVIQQDAFVYAGVLGSGETVQRNVAPGRYAWVQVARGSLSVNGQPLGEGDGAAISAENQLSITGAGTDGSEFLFFDLA